MEGEGEEKREILPAQAMPLLQRREEEEEKLDCIEGNGRDKDAGARFRYSSSDSDSGGSCSSGQEGGRRRGKGRSSRSTNRRTTIAASSSRGGRSKSGSSGNTSSRHRKGRSLRTNGRCSPQLQVAGEDELLAGGEEGEGERGILVSLTSSYHVQSMGGGRGDGSGANLPACPSLEKLKTPDTHGGARRGPMATGLSVVSSQEGEQSGSGWMDDIIERHISSFKRKFPELSAEFSSPTGSQRSLETPCVQ